jgi:thioredoxin 1
MKQGRIRLAACIVAAALLSLQAAAGEQRLPKLLDLGAGACVACKKMAPILEEMKKTYAGVLEVEFIDVWKKPAAGKQYGIKAIPTQIFYDAEGKERFRHVGFYSREDILAKWKELGYDLKPTAAGTKTGKSEPAAEQKDAGE